ncbi:hypothetical protein ACOSQ2_018698 [Xanthoceras sorbifolium]
MRFGLSIDFEAGFSPVLLEFDALSVVNLVISKPPPYSEIGLFIMDILNLNLQVNTDSPSIEYPQSHFTLQPCLSNKGPLDDFHHIIVFVLFNLCYYILRVF